jgi:hypothetical protein
MVFEGRAVPVIFKARNADLVVRLTILLMLFPGSRHLAAPEK